MSQEKNPVSGSTYPSRLPLGAPAVITPMRIAGGALVLPGTPHCTESVPRRAGWYSTITPSFFRAGPALWNQVFVSPSTMHSGPCPGATAISGDRGPARTGGGGGGTSRLADVTECVPGAADADPRVPERSSHPAENPATRRSKRTAARFCMIFLKKRRAADADGFAPSGFHRTPTPGRFSTFSHSGPSLSFRRRRIWSTARESTGPLPSYSFR